MARQEYAPGAGMWPRWISLILGVWLFISAFIWPHTQGAQTNTWILGVLIAAVAIWAMFMPMARWINAALAVWLFFSSLFIPHIAGTAWNNVIVAIIVFIMAMIPSEAATPTTRGPIEPHAPAPV